MSIKAKVVNDSTFNIKIGERFDFSLVTEFRNTYEDLDPRVNQIDIDLGYVLLNCCYTVYEYSR